MKKKLLYVIIVVHGSSDKKWILFCKKIKNNLKKNIFILNKIFISFINKKKPYLLNIIKKSIKNLIINFFIIPLFLSEGKHIKNDLNKKIKIILNIYSKCILFKTNCLNKNKKINNILNKKYINNINKCLSLLNNN